MAGVLSSVIATASKAKQEASEGSTTRHISLVHVTRRINNESSGAGSDTGADSFVADSEGNWMHQQCLKKVLEKIVSSL